MHGKRRALSEVKYKKIRVPTESGLGDVLNAEYEKFQVPTKFGMNDSVVTRNFNAHQTRRYISALANIKVEALAGRLISDQLCVFNQLGSEFLFVLLRIGL